MKICCIVAEYNPFHNGHALQLDFIKQKIKPDLIAVILSGNFVQRGEGAILNKYERSRHALISGADVVFELPSVFATQTAEVFASGAVKLINALPGEKVLCFGAECGCKKSIVKTARLMLNETAEYKQILKAELKKGSSLLKARETALSLTNKDFDLSVLSKPNNVLGVEYVKAILKNGYDIGVEVIKREGGDYLSSDISVKTPSALAIRTAIQTGNKQNVKGALPEFVYNDLPENLVSFDREIIYSLISTSKKDLALISDCAEGLENRIKALARENYSLDTLIEKLKTKRYTEARLKRILLSAMLGIDKKLVKSALKKDLYLKVLAIKKEKLDILSYLSMSKYPLLTRKSDAKRLNSTALTVFEKDVYCNDVYSLVTKNKTNEFYMVTE